MSKKRNKKHVKQVRRASDPSASIPFMELNRSQRRAMAKSRKLFKGDDRKAWQMLTHKEEEK